MSKLSFVICNLGSRMSITGTAKFEKSVSINRNLFLEVKDPSFFMEVKGLLKTHRVMYEKNTIPKSVEDLILEEYDELDVTKSRSRTKALDVLRSRLDSTVNFDFFEFTLLNNFFIEKGFVITEQNREEKYLEIISAGDDNLIDELERFLNCRDKLSQHFRWYEKFREFEYLIKDSDSQKEIEEALFNYLRLFE